MAQGFVRFRKIQVGKQSVIGTAVAATRVLPYRSLMVYDPQRTDPDVDTGTLAPTLAPYPVAPTVTMDGAEGPLAYNDLVVRLSAAGLPGGVTPTGNGLSGYTWTFQAADLTADTFDYYSVQTGDDTSDSAGAGTNAFGAVINVFSQSMDEGLGPWTVSDDWIAAGAVYGNRTAALNVDSTPEWVFGADTLIYRDIVAGAIGTTAITNAVRGATLTVNNNLDQKRYADGSNVRFNLSAFGRGLREITLDLVLEKTTQTIAMAATLDDPSVIMEYFKISSNSLELAGTVNTHRADIFLPMRLKSIDNGEIENNTNWTFHYTGYYDPTLLYSFRAVVLNSLSALP
jgi:hypothetical protein